MKGLAMTAIIWGFAPIFIVGALAFLHHLVRVPAEIAPGMRLDYLTFEKTTLALNKEHAGPAQKDSALDSKYKVWIFFDIHSSAEGTCERARQRVRVDLAFVAGCRTTGKAGQQNSQNKKENCRSYRTDRARKDAAFVDVGLPASTAPRAAGSQNSRPSRTA